MSEDYPEPKQPLKAEIHREGDTSNKIECQFNPKDFAITREIDWKYKQVGGKNHGDPYFAGGKPQNLDVDLWFDATDEQSPSERDVRKKYALLLEMAEIDTAKANPDTGKGEPPRCVFQWGKFLSFTGVIQSISQSFIMFDGDGTPTRAKVKVSFSETGNPPAAQNPTTRTETRRIWVVHEGQTLDWIAYEEYGDPAYWRHIAESNDLANPLDLHPGQVLRIPPLP
jgi:hypothetical protein